MTSPDQSALLTFGGDGLTAVVDPARGAKIVSLVDAAGHEWLLPPRESAAPPRAGTAFTEAEMGGWDECAPSIVACPAVDGRAVPDHGDLWDVAWTVDGERLSAQGSSLPYELTRRIVAVDGGLRLEYTVVARADTPWLWAAHPQFSAPPGSRVRADLTSVVDVLDGNETERAWTAALGTIDTVAAGGCRKVYAPADTRIDRAALEVPGRGVLTMNWDATSVPYLGIWFDHGAYSRCPVIALEPSTGFYDSLDVATHNGRVLTLTAGRPVSWHLEVTVG